MVIVAPLTNDYFKKVSLEALIPARAGYFENRLETLAGPSLRLWGLDFTNGVDNALWRGSVTYVTRDANSNYSNFPKLVLGSKPTQNSPFEFVFLEGLSFWRYDLDLETNPTDSTQVLYRLGAENS